MCVLGVLVLLGFAGGGAHEQKLQRRPDLLEGNGKLAEYYGPPNQTRMKSLLAWTRGQPLTNGLWLITEPDLQTFSVQGERTLGVQAPQCIVDRRGGAVRTVSSSGPMQAQLAGGKFSISGAGFLWRQTNSDLFISNDVHTVLHPDLLASAPAPAKSGKGPVHILSRQFEYSTNYGQATWSGDVRVNGEQLALNSSVLRAKLVSGQRDLQSLVAPSSAGQGQGQPQDKSSSQGRLENITAEQNVNVDYAGVQATGDHAVYTPETDQVLLTGHPTWRAQSRDGSADQLVLELTNNVLRATGHGVLKMPGQGLAMAGLLSEDGARSANAVPAKDQVLEILSESYIARTNLAVFRGPVQAIDRAGGEIRGTMSCGLLTVGLAQTNQLERMVAESQVVIHQQDRRLLAGKAVYEATNGVMDLTEEPRWQAGLRHGSGDLIRLFTKPEGMLVRGNASMLWPAEELASVEVVSYGPSAPSAASGAGGTAAGAANRPAPAKPGETNSPMAEITAEEYTMAPEGTVFERQARIKHPQMNWTSETITVQSPEGSSTRRILAQTAVWFELLGENDRKLEGLGDRADYAYSVTNGITNEVMVLTGNPAHLKMMRNPAPLELTWNSAESKSGQGEIEDALITLDRTHNRIRTSKSMQWAIQIETQPANTNSLKVTKYTPKKKYQEKRMPQ
jgi:lipopolysaccharide export system protein LptA